MVDSKQWQIAQAWEKQWHDICTNTFGEEWKQTLYARKMGLQFFHDGKSPFNIDLQGKSIVDIGGGPSSLLLKCVNGGTLLVVDPLDFPAWVRIRYEAAGIIYGQLKAEELYVLDFDECWIYNVLQHVDDPQEVIEAARASAYLIRIFEWIDTPVNDGHPQSLTEEALNRWLGGEGKVEVLRNDHNCTGRCYYGVFPT